LTPTEKKTTELYLRVFYGWVRGQFVINYKLLISAIGYEGLRERDIGMITPPQAQLSNILQPVGLPHYTHGVTGHHVLTVQAFQKEQVVISLDQYITSFS